MKFTVLGALLALLIFPVCAQFNNIGLPKVSYYTPKDYDANPQITKVFQANNGLLYFTNPEALLEYDGNSFRKIYMPNKGAVRSIGQDRKGKIYIGAKGDFGYLEVDKTGSTIFESLKSKLPPKNQDFEDIWRLWVVEDGVIFQSIKALYIYKAGKFKVIEAENRYHTSAYVNGKFLLREWDKGLLVLEGDKLIPIPGGEVFAQERIYQMLPYDDKILLVTNKHGLILYDGSSLVPFRTEADDFLRSSYIYAGCKYKDNYVIGSYTNGFVIIDKQGKLLMHLNKEKGLLANKVLHLYVGKDENLWVGQETGVNYVELNSPFRFLDDRVNLSDVVEKIAYREGVLYAGTESVLKYISKEELLEKKLGQKSFKKVEGVRGETWELFETKYGLISSGGSNTLLVTDEGTKELYRYGMYDIFRYWLDTSVLIGGHRDEGIGIFKIHKGIPEFKQKLKNWTQISEVLAQDTAGNIWVSHANRGVFKLTVDSGLTQVKSHKIYTHEHGLPSTYRNYVFNKGKEVWVGTEKGIYRYDATFDRFKPHNAINESFSSSVSQWAQADKGSLYLWGENGLSHVKLKNGEASVESAIFNKIDAYTINDFLKIDDLLLMATDDGIISYNTAYSGQRTSPEVYIRSMYLPSNDSIIYGGQGQKQLELAPEMREVGFVLGNSHMENPKKVKYQYRLRGYNEKLSEWTSRPEKEYTNLPDGDYEFQVRARDQYGNTSEFKSLTFKILTPWYKSWWAYVIYAAIIACMVMIIVWLYTLKLRKSNLRLESIIALRTEKLNEQKDKLKAANQELNTLHREKNQLLGLLAHDLRGPVASFSVLANVMEQHINNKRYGELPELNNLLKEALGNLTNLLENLINWALTHEQNSMYRPSQIKIGHVIDQVLASFQQTASDKSIDLQQNVIKGTEVYADENALKAVLRNIVHNAIKFTPEGGKVKVHAKREDKFCAISVSDNGTGMDQEKIEQLFGNGKISHTVGTKGETGTGLGLLLCRELIAKNHGTLEIESKPEEGTTISILFPCELVKK